MKAREIRKSRVPAIALLCLTVPFSSTVSAASFDEPDDTEYAEFQEAESQTLDAWGQLTEAEEQTLLNILATIPDEVLERGDQAEIEDHITARVLMSPEAGMEGQRILPAIVIAVKAASCVVGAYNDLKGLNSNSTPSQVAWSVASAISGCVGLPAGKIVPPIIKHKGKIAKALKAIGLKKLADKINKL